MRDVGSYLPWAPQMRQGPSRWIPLRKLLDGAGTLSQRMSFHAFGMLLARD